MTQSAQSAVARRLKIFLLRCTGAQNARCQLSIQPRKRIKDFARFAATRRSICLPICVLYSRKNVCCWSFCWGKSPMSICRSLSGQRTAAIILMVSAWHFPQSSLKKQTPTSFQSSWKNIKAKTATNTSMFTQNGFAKQTETA